MDRLTEGAMAAAGGAGLGGWIGGRYGYPMTGMAIGGAGGLLSDALFQGMLGWNEQTGYTPDDYIATAVADQQRVPGMVTSYDYLRTGLKTPYPGTEQAEQLSEALNSPTRFKMHKRGSEEPSNGYLKDYLEKTATTSAHRFTQLTAPGSLLAGTVVPGSGSVANMVGTAIGLSSDYDPKHLKDNTDYLYELLPGVGYSRAMAQAEAVSKEKGRHKHEMMGSLVQPLVAGAVGSGAGALGGYLLSALSDDPSPLYNTLMGTAGGLVLGGGVLGEGSQLAATLGALLTPTRSTKDQDRADRSQSVLSNYMMPGRASYNFYKRQGYAYDQLFEGAEADKR